MINQFNSQWLPGEDPRDEIKPDPKDLDKFIVDPVEVESTRIIR